MLSSLRTAALPAVGLALALAACTSASSPVAAVGTARGSGSVQAAAGPEYGKGLRHGQGTCRGRGLAPTMRALMLSLATVQSGLEEGNLRIAAEGAKYIAESCDYQHGFFNPNVYGPAFLQLDSALHRAAQDLASHADAGDLEAARRAYGSVADTCLACHMQAPKARRVRLGRLAQRFDKLR